jgi:ABC-type sulfate transport system substrate-binding protein
MIYALFAIILSLLPVAGFAEPVRLLNVSYDPTLELYQEFNQRFLFSSFSSLFPW